MTRRLRYHTIIGSQNGGDAHLAAQDLTRTLLSILDQFADATPEITLEALKPTYLKSQVYVPKKTGRMSASGYLEIVQFRGNPRVEMGYGKHGDPHYTMYVHENTGMAHNPPTRSKWLQAAVFEDIAVIPVRLGEGYSAFMNGSGSGR